MVKKNKRPQALVMDGGIGQYRGFDEELTISETEGGIKQDDGYGPPKLYWPQLIQDPKVKGGILQQGSEMFFGVNDRVLEFSIFEGWNSGRRNKYPRTEGLFWQALCGSRIVYIVDLHFEGAELDYILNVLKEADRISTVEVSKINILCSKTGYNQIQTIKRQWEHNENLEYPHFDIVPVNVGDLGDKSGFGIHDRFVLVDNVIWHFGWTVGGIKPILTAYSGGWKDTDDRFKEYLDAMIKQATGR